MDGLCKDMCTRWQPSGLKRNGPYCKGQRGRPRLMNDAMVGGCRYFYSKDVTATVDQMTGHTQQTTEP